jgi:predicted ester cyclase
MPIRQASAQIAVYADFIPDCGFVAKLAGTDAGLDESRRDDRRPTMEHGDENRNAELARNVEIALRFKKSQGTAAMPQVEKEVLAPDYQRARGGSLHLAANALDQGFPEPGLYMRQAFPDRVDVIENVVAEDDRVGLLFRVTATHSGNFFGIAPTGKKIDVYEIAMLRIVNGLIVHGWFMMDETALLQQLGARMPKRNDGRVIAPPLVESGEDADAMMRSLEPPASPLDRNKLIALRSRLSPPPNEYSSADFRRRRHVVQHLQDYGKSRGAGAESLIRALADLRVGVDAFIAEGDQVWMRFNISGTHRRGLYGLPATGRRVWIPGVSILRFAHGQLRESWTFGDELGLLLQFGLPNVLLG